MTPCHVVGMSGRASSVASAPAEPAQQPASTRIQIILILSIAVAARLVYWNMRPPDMDDFLEPWFAHIVHYGPVGAFAHPFSNYEPAYLYLLALGSLAHGFLAPMTIIKMISVAGTLFLTTAFAAVLKSADVDRRGALLLLVLPSIVINDALLGQCDALWAGACLFGLAAMIRGQTLRAMIWCGVAIAFKMQAAFIAPVMIGAMIGRRAPWWQWSIPAAVFLASVIPPWILGWPLIKLLTVYAGQASLDQIAGRLSNPWMFGTVFAEHGSRSWFMIGYVAAGAAAAVIAALAARNPRDPRLLILLAALAGTALPFLLPKMLERYYFLGDVMTLALALSWRCRPAAIAVGAVQVASMLAHITYMYFFFNPWPTLVGAGCAAVGLVAMCQLAAPSFGAMAADLRSLMGRKASPGCAAVAPSSTQLQ